MTIIADFINLLYPKTCIVCELRLVDGEKYICLTCLSKIPKTGYHKMKNNPLEEFFFGRFPFLRISAYAHFVKGGTLQPIIHELKYKNNPQLGNYMGELSGLDLCQSPFLKGIDYIVPVPIHPNRAKQRGYNQALQIAEGLSLKTGIAVDATNLIRVIDNPSQTTQSKFQRWDNVEGIFRIKDPKLFAGKHILLIDDIITTGSTIEGCAKNILQCNETKVSIFAIGCAI